MTGGCATSLATQPPAANLPADCDQEPVPYPAIGGKDLGVSRAEYAAALGQANTRIVSGNKCNARVRGVYARRGR
jgi:hypothetical protein